MRDDSGWGWSRAGRTGFALALVSIGLLIASETVLRPDHEVLYSRPAVSARCTTTAGRDRCWASASFAIANNGRVAQDDVRLNWALDVQRWSLSCRDSDLIGSTKRRKRPRLRAIAGAGALAYEIRAFDPNTILDCSVDCLRCAREDVLALRRATFTVSGAGVTEADPRSTMFARFFINAGRVLGALSP